MFASSQMKQFVTSGHRRSRSYVFYVGSWIPSKSNDDCGTCQKCEPFLRNAVESRNRPTEMPSALAYQHGTRKRDPCNEIDYKTHTIGRKCVSHTTFGIQSANRSSEMLPKTRTVRHKMSYDLNANRPGSGPRGTPWGPVLQPFVYY